MTDESLIGRELDGRYKVTERLGEGGGGAPSEERLGTKVIPGFEYRVAACVLDPHPAAAHNGEALTQLQLLASVMVADLERAGLDAEDVIDEVVGKGPAGTPR